MTLVRGLDEHDWALLRPAELTAQLEVGRRPAFPGFALLSVLVTATLNRIRVAGCAEHASCSWCHPRPQSRSQVVRGARVDRFSLDEDSVALRTAVRVRLGLAHPIASDQVRPWVQVA